VLAIVGRRAGTATNRERHSGMHRRSGGSHARKQGRIAIRPYDQMRSQLAARSASAAG